MNSIFNLNNHRKIRKNKELSSYSMKNFDKKNGTNTANGSFYKGGSSFRKEMAQIFNPYNQDNNNNKNDEKDKKLEKKNEKKSNDKSNDDNNNKRSILDPGTRTHTYYIKNLEYHWKNHKKKKKNPNDDKTKHSYFNKLYIEHFKQSQSSLKYLKKLDIPKLRKLSFGSKKMNLKKKQFYIGIKVF